MLEIKIKNDFLTPSRYTRPGTIRERTTGIVLHYIGNPGTTAKNNRDYFESLKEGKPDRITGRIPCKSSHYIIGLKGEILCLMPDEEVSYTSGGSSYKPGILETLTPPEFKKSAFHVRSAPHLFTIGIEVCHPDFTGSYTPETYEAQKHLGAFLLKKHNLMIENLYRHYDITGKECPRWFVRNPGEWEKFKKEVKATMEEY